MAGPASPAHFCRSCGAELAERQRTCPSCGSELGAPTGIEARPIFLGSTSTAALAKVAGLVWLAIAVVSIGGAVVEATSGGTLTAWAAASAGLELISGVALFASPTWTVLTATALWGALSVLGTLLLVARGSAPGPVGIVLAGAIAVATLISFVARRRMDADEAAGRVP